MGTTVPRYDERLRGFDSLDAGNAFAFRTMPQRFAAYLAMHVPGDRASFGPMEYVEGERDHAGTGGDQHRMFWVPLHKLFAGGECIAGHNLKLELVSGFRNEKLRRFHLKLQALGFSTEWIGADLDRYPFVITDEAIASLSRRRDYGPGVLEPRPAPFVNRARFRGRWLTFTVPPGWSERQESLYFSSGQILEGEPDTEPSYMQGLAQQTDRSAPEYVSLRHRVLDDGSIEDLNSRPDMWEVLRAGGYAAQHFVDFSGDGWVSAVVDGLPRGLGAVRPAFATVSPPDFFPLVSQRELTTWWESKVPAAVRNALWAVPPHSLASRRMAANVQLGRGFSVYDDTMTCVVSHPAAQTPELPDLGPSRYSGLPDHSPGVFDPGWDASQGLVFTDPSRPLRRFLQTYGLGTPFVEDVKLCAALGSYWPAIAPDGTRNFTPLKAAAGFPYPWPTIVPLTDEETGILPADGRFLPWDGVNGPHVVERDGARMVRYADIDRVDYIGVSETMTAALLSTIDLAETTARVLAMEAVYWALGVRDPEVVARFAGTDVNPVMKILEAKAAWGVISFRALRTEEVELAQAEQSAGRPLGPGRRYRFHVYRPGEQVADPSDIRHVLVAIAEEGIAYVGGTAVLLKRGGGPWTRDSSMPTS
jgi:hypothetical protein